MNELIKQGILRVMRCVPDKPYLTLMYLAKMKKVMHWRSPVTFNEKLQWLKLYDRKMEYTHMVDKHKAKKYVADKVGEEYIIPTLGVWERFEDIDFDALPDQFVLKCTHDSGGLVICRDRKTFDIGEAKVKIEKSLKNNFFYYGREWPYKNVKPRIIAEQYMEENYSVDMAKEKQHRSAQVEVEGLTDYKFYCFDGKPEFLYISKGLEDHSTARISFVTMDWKFAPYMRSDYMPFEELPPRPQGFDEMVRLAKELSKGFPFLRVDLYQIGNKVYFSELTFSPCSGFMPLKNLDHDVEIGQLIALPKEKKRK